MFKVDVVETAKCPSYHAEIDKVVGGKAYGTLVRSQSYKAVWDARTGLILDFPDISHYQKYNGDMGAARVSYWNLAKFPLEDTMFDKMEIGLTHVTPNKQTVVVVARITSLKFPWLATLTSPNTDKHLGTAYYDDQGRHSAGMTLMNIPLGLQGLWDGVSVNIRQAVRALSSEAFEDVKNHLTLVFPNREKEIYDALQSGTLS